MLVQRRRDRRAALRLMRKLLRRQGFTPKSLTTDKLGSYGAAFWHLGLTCPHEQRLRANNRAENLYGAAGVKRGDSICRPLLGELSAGSRLAPTDRPESGGDGLWAG
jgi:hypothetical protein